MSNGDPEQPLGPPPVEPLSDIAWARVERNLWDRLDAGEPARVPTSSVWRKRIAWVAAPIAIAAAVTIFVASTRGGGGDAPPSMGSDGPMRVVSGGAPSSLSYGDAHVTLEADSAVVMSRATDETTAIVERGAAWFEIAPRAERLLFVVVAGDTMVRVVGTRFRVARFAEVTTVEVEHGLVDASFRGRRISLGAGQSWTSAHPDDISPVRTALAPVPEPDPTQVPVVVDPPVTPTRPDPVDPTPARPDPTRPARPDSVDPTPARPDRVIDPRPDPTRSARPEPARPEPTPGSATAKPPLPPKPATGSAATGSATNADDARARFERLAALESRDPGAAIAGYLELSARGGRWAEVGLYAAARLAADRRDARAANLLTVYLRRFPRGANADDVRILLARIQNGATR